MKCPQCGTTYTDESLRFCLADGAELVREGAQMRIDIPAAETRIVPDVSQKRSPSKAWIFIALGAAIIGLMFVAGVIVIGILAYIGSAENDSEITFATPTPSAAPTRPQTDEERIKTELEKLEQKLAEMEEPPITGDPFPDDLKEAAGFPIDATVNSPNDGFLALRSVPSTEIGDRIAAIPHGTKVQVIVCDQTYHTKGGNRGRWCLLMWGENAGWAFDAWLAF